MLFLRFCSFFVYDFDNFDLSDVEEINTYITHKRDVTGVKTTFLLFKQVN